MKRKQKFNRGDLVQIKKRLDPAMSHFPSGMRAIVLGSYADEYPHFDKNAIDNYSLNVKGHGNISWYRTDQLTLIKKAPFVSIKFNGQ